MRDAFISTVVAVLAGAIAASTLDAADRKGSDAAVRTAPSSTGSYAVVVSGATRADTEWKQVVDALVAKHKATTIVYQNGVEESLPSLSKQHPRYTCFVSRPSEATRQFVANVHRLTRKLDDDPYTDTLWGILTGFDAKCALRVAKHDQPLTVRKVASGTEIAMDMVEEGVWYCELKKNRMVRKRSGGKPVEEKGPNDTTKALVDTLNEYHADLFVTSGHATERDWQIGFAYRNGSFRSKAGKLVGHDTHGKTHPINSTNPKVYLPIGNCLMGHVDGPDAMALAWMNSAGVYQMIGYTVPTWFGYAGWGCLDYFVEQPGRYTFIEAFLANHHALIHRLENGVGSQRGLQFDRDVLAFYGDPAWAVRMADGPRAFEQELNVDDGIYTFKICGNRGEDSFKPINANGSQRGWRPIVEFLPFRLKDIEIVDDGGLDPVITDDFILIPNPREYDPGRRYEIRFKATRCNDQSASNEKKFAAKFIKDAAKGYVARPCGFDMNRNGIPGEPADRTVGDGKTRDPDGDGVEEDILYVDSEDGDDQAGDGSPGKPYRTIQKALDSADGPKDGAEDIICIAGKFHESLVMHHGGGDGHYERDEFQFPRNPTMIIGWDKDGDGQYPPYDQDDTAVLDGQQTLAWAIANQNKLSFIEIAHLTVKDYGYKDDNCGALKLFRWGTGAQSHIYVHDVEFRSINKGQKDSSAKIVFNFWGGPMTYVAVMNNLVDEYSSYFCRGAPPDEAGHFRFQNNTLKMHGKARGSFVTGWKLWGHHRDVEILDNVVDCNAHAWKPVGHVSGIGVCQGTQDWTIRGNVLIDLGVTLQPFAKGYPFERTLNNIVIDRNVFRSTYDGWTWPRFGIKIQGYPDAPVHQTVENATITNNFFSTSVGWGAAILCGACNGTGPQPGTITIAGNTMCGPFDRSRAGIAIAKPRQEAFLQRSFVIKNNIIANAGPGLNVAVNYAPNDFVADGNLYDTNASFRWNEPKHWLHIPFMDWKSTTGQDANSRAGESAFVDTSSGDLHLLDSGTIARSMGVDITPIIQVDFDAQPRDAMHPVTGADVPNR